MDKQENYTRVTASDNYEYICPLHIAKDKAKLQGDQLEDCVEAEVVGRYIGHLNIITPE